MGHTFSDRFSTQQPAPGTQAAQGAGSSTQGASTQGADTTKGGK